MDSKQLLVEALHLPDDERAALAGELIGSLDHDVDADAEAAWSTERDQSWTAMNRDLILPESSEERLHGQRVP